jgi:outer membrane lipoprotein-sorting protein
MKKTFAVLLFVLAFRAFASAAGTNSIMASWLAAQTNLQSWSADFVQTRALKSLTEPLTATGRVWFAAPNRFRWELGHPAQTIAVRGSDDLLVIYPRLKRVEKFPLAGDQANHWRDALGLLEAGFPRSQAELERQYNLLSQTAANGACELVLQPKSASARRMIPQIKVDFSVTNLSLLGTELEFSDGSRLRNEFTNAVLNPPLDAQMFAAQIPSDYKVVEPLKKH